MNSTNPYHSPRVEGNANQASRSAKWLKSVTGVMVTASVGCYLFGGALLLMGFFSLSWPLLLAGSLFFAGGFLLSVVAIVVGVVVLFSDPDSADEDETLPDSSVGSTNEHFP